MEFCAALEERRKFLLNHLQRQVKDSKELVENSQESCDQLPLSETNYANIYSELVKEVEWKAINRFQRLINNIEMLSKGLKSAPVNDEAVKLDIHKIIEAHLKRQSTTKDSVLNTEKLYSLLEAEKSERLSNNLASKKLKGSVSRRLHPVVSQSYMKNLYQLSGTNGKTEKVLEKSWPKSENGFFCLLRGFLTHGGERRKLTTAQICEHVREWQLYNQSRLRKLVEDWSSVTPHALTFLTAESVAESIVPNGSRRLICPRPFVDSKPRIHQWCWLLCPPSGTNSKLVQEWNYKFELETKELVGLFSEWLRAPRGLGGLTDAVLSILDFSISTMKSKNKHKNSTPSGKEKQHSQGSGCSSVGSTEVDSEPDEVQRCLRIDDCQMESDGGATKGRIRQKSKKKAYSKHSEQSTFHEDYRLYSDDSVPPPLYPTRWKLRPFTREEKADFQSQEAERFSHPWLPFVYHIQDYYAVVGPLRSAPSALNHELISLNSCRNWSGHSKARDHPLLRLDRPMFVSLSEIVRDAVACLPNGEGTRADITVLVQNSGFLLPNTNPRQLQQCVSSALDRLQGETSDPSVYFNSDRRMWIYRHRNRSVEQFAELHEARCAVYETKKIIQRGGNATSVNSISKRPNQFNPEKHSVYLSKHNSLRDSSSRISRRYQCSGGRQIQSGYVSRDYGYMELSGGYSLNEDDDHIPDIEELEAADEINMTEYSCTSASGSMDPYEVEVHEANNNMVDDEGDIDKVNYENEILSDWDDDKSTDRTVSYPTSQHDNHDLTKRVRYLDPFQSRSPTSFIMPSHNRSQATSAHNDTKHSRSQNSAFSSDSKRRYTNYDGSDAQFEDYVIDNEGIDEEYF